MRRRYSALLLSCFALSSCGYAIEQSHQDLTLVTPGAENAHCFVYIDKVKYQMYPPQTINIMKSENDMTVECLAPGNRDKTVMVPAQLTERAIWGTPAGMAWDYAAKSLFHYPAVVAVDFSSEKIKPFKLPKHNSSDIMKPEDHLLEEILPATPRLNKDRDDTKEGLTRRDEEPEAVDAPDYSSTDKGSLLDVIDRLQSSEPASEPESEAAEPTPLYPGE